MSVTQSISPRILGLVSAMEILTAEGLITKTVHARIKNRIAEILKINQTQVAELVLSYLANLTEETSEVVEIEIPELPGELKFLLSKREYLVISTLLENFGKQVRVEDLVEAVYNEVMDTSIPDDDNKVVKKLRVVISATRKKIKGWGIIKSKQGRGYWLEILGK